MNKLHPTSLIFCSQEAPILDMLKKWLGDDAFNAAMGKAPPKADPVAAKQPETSSKVPKAAPSQPPLVLIREGVAAQTPGKNMQKW